MAYDVERVLADIDADHGDRRIGYLRHGLLLVFGAPCQLRWLAGQEHGRTIPLADQASVIRYSSASLCASCRRRSSGDGFNRPDRRSRSVALDGISARTRG